MDFTGSDTLAERQREVEETEKFPDVEAEEVAEILRGYGLTEEHVGPAVQALSADQDRWVDFMMRFELGLEAPDPARARQSALTIALSYIAGGLVPLSPYLIFRDLTTAFYVSVGVTLAALFVFGFVKAKVTGIAPLRGGLQTTLTGGVAAAAAFAIARLIG